MTTGTVCLLLVGVGNTFCCPKPLSLRLQVVCELHVSHAKACSFVVVVVVVVPCGGNSPKKLGWKKFPKSCRGVMFDFQFLAMARSSSGVPSSSSICVVRSSFFEPKVRFRSLQRVGAFYHAFVSRSQRATGCCDRLRAPGAAMVAAMWTGEVVAIGG